MSDFLDKLSQFIKLEVKDDNDYIEHLQFIKDNRQHWDDADMANELGGMLVYYFEANRRLLPVGGHKPEESDRLEEIYRKYEHRLTSQNKVDILQSLSIIILQKIKNDIEAIDAVYTKARDFVKEIYYIASDEIYRGINDGVVTAFSFRPFSKYALNDVCLNEITLCNPDMFNDPFDTVFPHWIDYTLNKLKDGQSCAYEHLRIMKDTFQSIKARSLVLGTNGNVRKLPKLMWAHYADEHKGFCIKYKIDKDFFYSHSENESVLACFKMNYINDKFSFDNGIHLSKALMSKCNIWKYEKEFRILLFNPKNNENFISLPLNEHFRMTDIYLGLRCQKADQRMMESLLQNKPIRLHRMKEKLPYAYKLDCDCISKRNRK